MKLSAHHESNGLAGTIRFPATGEVIHFMFDKGVTALPIHVECGGHVMETFLTLDRAASDLHPEHPLDMEVRMTAPAGPSVAMRSRSVVPAAKGEVRGAIAGDGQPLVHPDAGNGLMGLKVAEGPKLIEKFKVSEGLPPGPEADEGGSVPSEAAPSSVPSLDKGAPERDMARLTPKEGSDAGVEPAKPAESLEAAAKVEEAKVDPPEERAKPAFDGKKGSKKRSG